MGVYFVHVDHLQWVNSCDIMIENGGDTMPIAYKIDIIQALKDKGYTSYRIRVDKLIGERQMQQIRSGEVVSNACLAKLCKLLQCQPGDLIEYVDDSTGGDEDA